MLLSTCKGCGRQAKLINSHVIPEWAYKSVYTGKHKFAKVSASKTDRIVAEQKGWRERLLCDKCETYLSKLENALYRDVKAMRSGIRQVVLNKGIVLSFVEKTLPNYEDFKKGVLSVLWRMSVSERVEFKNYKLKEDESVIKEYVFDPKAVLEWAAYPIVVFRLTIGQKADSGILMLYPETEFVQGIVANSFAIYGLQFLIYMYKPTLSGEIRSEIARIENLALKGSGRLTIADVDAVEVISKGSLFGRLKASDVRSFYKRFS